MIILLDLIASTVTQGLIYAFIAYGMYITYKILDFPDMTVEGSFALGAAVTAVMLTHGVNPYVTLLVALIVGAVSGFFTGFIHVVFRVRDLIAGIITMTALFSINLQLAGSNLVVAREIETIFTSRLSMALLGDIPLMWKKLIVSFVLVLIAKIVIDLYLQTKSGLLLRAVGDNSTLVTSLAKDKGKVKIIGLTISNALVGFAGCIVCQEQRSFSAMMGTGQVVFGLATVIIGTTLFRRLDFVRGTTAVVCGSVIYKACIQIAISLGLPPNLMKLVTAILFLAILIFGERRKRTSAKKKGVSVNA